MDFAQKTRTAIVPILIIFAASLIVMAPALFWNDMIRGGDMRFHMRWQEYFAEHLWSGNLYPRWLSDMNGGFGSPVFFIYPPLSHAFTALFRPFLADVNSLPLRLAIAALISVAASGVLALLWLRRLDGATVFSATSGALAYILVPYHAYVDIYHRGAFAEVFAFVWPPLSLLCIHGLADRPRRSFFLLSVSIAALLATHLPSSLIMLPLYLCYAGAIDFSEKSLRHVTWTVIAMICGIMLAGAYFATALAHASFINTDAMFTNGMEIWRFLLGNWTAEDTAMKKAILVCAMAQVPITVIFLFVSGVSSRNKTRTIAWVALAGVILMTFLMSAPGRFFWELNTPANKMQFPWRMMLAVAVCASLAISLAASNPGLLGRSQRFVGVTVCTILLGFLVLDASLYALRLKADRDMHRVPLSAAAALQDNWDAPEYQLGPRAMVETLFPADAKAIVSDGVGTLSLVDWGNTRSTFRVHAESNVTVLLHQFFYTGWSFRIAESAQQGLGTAAANSGLASFNLPAGDYAVTFELDHTRTEILGWVLSLAGIFACGLVTFVFLPKER